MFCWQPQIQCIHTTHTHTHMRTHSSQFNVERKNASRKTMENMYLRSSNLFEPYCVCVCGFVIHENNERLLVHLNWSLRTAHYTIHITIFHPLNYCHTFIWRLCAIFQYQTYMPWDELNFFSTGIPYHAATESWPKNDNSQASSLAS